MTTLTRGSCAPGNLQLQLFAGPLLKQLTPCDEVCLGLRSHFSHCRRPEICSLFRSQFAPGNAHPRKMIYMYNTCVLQYMEYNMMQRCCTLLVVSPNFHQLVSGIRSKTMARSSTIAPARSRPKESKAWQVNRCKHCVADPGYFLQGYMKKTTIFNKVYEARPDDFS